MTDEAQTQTVKPPRGRPPTDSSRDRMTNLLQIAREHFIRDGYRATTVDAIAAAAGITKRTLYSWHGDKASLFRACVIKGAQQFPVFSFCEQGSVRRLLEDYALALITRLSTDESRGLGILYPREGREFPEIAPIVQQVREDYMVKPLAAYLQDQGMERARSTAHSRLFVAMILAPIHDRLLLGSPLPGPTAMRKHARSVVALFLHGAVMNRPPVEPEPDERAGQSRST